MSQASTNDPQPVDHPPAARPDLLAKIVAITAELRLREISPPEAFVWAYHDESHWWAFGRFGRYTVMTPRRFGWGVGDYPWEAGVKQGQGSISNEIFVKPTFVDAAGRIAPLGATRVTSFDNHLLTDIMLQDIAHRMEQIAADSVN
ncbi:MAG TPA: hypothetical protein VLL08_18205 [Kineosporiaceae bacterium]|nr:hypothetical protein [Kineosporiaceae bacterium]